MEYPKISRKQFPLNEYNLVHSTYSIEEILKSGFISPILNTNQESEWFSELNLSNKEIKVYKESIWTSFLYPINNKVGNLDRFIPRIETRYKNNIYIFLNVEKLHNDGLLKNSYYCPYWNSLYSSNFCYKYNENISIKNQFNDWRKIDYDYYQEHFGSRTMTIYGMPHNEVVLYAPNGISTKYIKYLAVKNDEIKNEMKRKYPEYVWI
jgi:hypothetical protein